MPYLLKTFWPFAAFKKYCQNEEELLEAVEEILDYTEEFYHSEGIEFDTCYFASNLDGIRILKLEPDKMVHKGLKSFFTRSHLPITTREMYEYATQYKERKEELQREICDQEV